jgi:chaperonin GroES
MKSLVALHDKIVLKKLESDQEMVGGIIIPDTGKEKSNHFQVISVGEGMYNPYSPVEAYFPMKSKVGDIVIVPKAVVTEVKIDGEEYYICREVEILATLVDLK